MVGWTSRPGLAIAVVACLVLGSLGIAASVSFDSNGPSEIHTATPTPAASSSASPPATPSSDGGLAHALAVEHGLQAKGISPAKVHLPNFGGEVARPHQPVSPSYTQAPAPMGVADIGLENESGVLVPYELNTTSVAGTVAITNLESLYVDGDGPDTYGIQENSVVSGVTIRGNSSYEFWSQNYIGYTVSTHNLTFGDEVWNFSDPSGYFPQNSIYNFSPNGTFDDFPYLYQGYGPSITIAYPFTLTLYLNASTLGDRPALYFNYTVSNATFRQSASFDYLVFNSTVGTPTQPAPTPYYQADGYDYDPIGLINDMEIDILGNDDGDMTAFTAADATVSLQYWNATPGRMEEVPSAFNAGQETGETTVGLLVYSDGGANPVATVRSGPALVGGLWNYSAQTGAVADTVTVHPVGQYSFLFINVGSSIDVSGGQWVPTSTTGTTTFYLPTGGTYFLDFMMSEYTPASRVVTATTSRTLPPVTLAANPALGIYTPLFAFTNAELASISSAGAGTQGNPYVLFNNQPGPLAAQFAAWDDYLFPEFPGLLIAGTSAWVDVTPPSFEINLPSWDFSAPYVAGLPLTNNLQLQFYDASNVSLVHAAGILGWMSAFLGGFPESSVMFWNCTNSIVLSNTFDDQGNSLLLYGGTNNVVWGNTFLTTPVAAADPSSVDGSGGWDTGVNETESGDLVYNNQFDVGIPAITVTYDPFPCDQYGYCYPVAYTDSWNVSEQPAANYSVVDGWNLTGSIIGTTYQGGNYWSNYGTGANPFGVLPYNNSGAITVGGDFVPLVPFSLYAVTIQETGLPIGTPWTVTLDGATAGSNGTMLNVSSPNGTFPLTVAGSDSWQPFNPPTNVTVLATPVTVNVTFVEWTTLECGENYLGSGVTWSVSVTGAPLGNATISGNATLPSPAASFGFGPGYQINLTVPVGGPYTASAFAPGYNNTNGPYTDLTIPYFYPPPLPSYRIVFTFAPLPGTLDVRVTPSDASLIVSGQPVTLSSGTASVTLAPGIASIEALEVGYLPFFTNVTVVTDTTTFDNITMIPVVPGDLSLTVHPSTAELWVDGVVVALLNGSYSASRPPGIYSIEVTAAGYYPYYNNVSVISNQTVFLPISLNAIGSSSSGTWGIGTAGWAIIVGLAVLAAAFVVGMVYFARRGRQGGGPPRTPPAQPWQETPPPAK